MSDQKIVNTTRDGDIIHETLEMAKKDDFQNVAKIWLDKTITYDEGLEKLAAGKAETEDIVCGLDGMMPISVTRDNKQVFAMRDSDGRDFVPTEHALRQMGTRFLNSTSFPTYLAEQKRDGWAELLATNFKYGRAWLAQDIAKSNRMCEKFLFRTRTDGSMRAMLTSDYKCIDNEWYLNVLREAVPGGRLSHWRGDGDTIFGNVLIHDSIREEDDSDYGGMISVGNCEIGTRRISQRPSLFRAICMNGCIWGQKFGNAIKQIHRGKIDLVELRQRIISNIHKQIPLLPVAVDNIMVLRSFETEVQMKVVYAELARQFKLPKPFATAVLKGHNDEVKATNGQYKNTLFGALNAVTRAGQTLSNANWVKFDEIGGEMLDWDENKWNNVTSRASKLEAKVVDETFATAV